MRLVLPPHKASCHITHNQHLAYYETVQQMIEGEPGAAECFVSDEERERAYQTNELWQVQWCPDTPVGSCIVYASSLEALNSHFEMQALAAEYGKCADPNGPEGRRIVQQIVDLARPGYWTVSFDEQADGGLRIMVGKAYGDSADA